MNRRAYEHVFSKESKEALSKFFEAVKNSEAYHDVEHIKKESKKWSRIMGNLTEFTDLDESVANLLSVDESNNSIAVETNLNPDTNITSEDYDIVDDKHTVHYLAVDLQKEPVEKIQQIYSNLLPEIDLPKLIDIGNLILQSNSSDLIVECYCRELLFKMMAENHSDELLKLFHNFHAHFTRTVTSQLTLFLRAHDDLESFIKNLFPKLTSDPEFPKKILRAYLNSFEGPLTARDIFLFEFLAFKDTDLMKIMIEILSMNVEAFKTDKNYGKLLSRIVDILGSEVHLFLNSIDSILKVHNSLWVASVKKKICKYTK